MSLVEDAETWQALDEHDGVRAGELTRPRRLPVDVRRVELLQAAVDLVLGPAQGRSVTLQDVCPDPLVHALQAGLPRPKALDRQIDGGSSWTQLLGVEDGEQLVSVSSVASIEERRTSRGSRLVRTTFLTELMRPGTGERVGWCTGTSLDLEVAR
ncbi:hypothetical protein [uncultured Serinicoccus sp.]|uniref:hypothetical protein n=1 Tax=uncultured Serinicoccus sp. TaxID=735514 RepID=UPI00260659C8|nr:hypothetical protein [uncultured Serinicoccus sp.]